MTDIWDTPESSSQRSEPVSSSYINVLYYINIILHKYIKYTLLPELNLFVIRITLEYYKIINVTTLEMTKNWLKNVIKVGKWDVSSWDK